MADLKEKFRAAKEQRGSGTLSLAQVKALKAQKAAQQKQQAPAAQPKAAAPPPQQQKPVPASKAAAGGLPDDFFEQPAAKRQAVAAPSNPSPSLPSAPAPLPSSSSKPGDTSLPAGFFADKAADAKARGIKLPNAKDKEDDFQAFQRMMEEEMKVAAVKEAEEAEEEAGDKEDREQFEQRLRMQRLQKLVQPKGRSQEDPALQGEGVPMDAAVEALGLSSTEQQQTLVLPRKKRVIDTMRELGTAPGQEGGALGDSDEDDSVSEDELLDWRAKGV